MSKGKMGNHFKNHQIFSTKSGLLDTLNLIYSNDLAKTFDIMPLSYKIEYNPQKGIKGLKQFTEMFNSIEASKSSLKSISKNTVSTTDTDPEQQKTLPAADKFSTLTPCLNQGKNVWVLKPTHLNRGRGITLFNSLEQLVNDIKNPEFDL